MNLNDSSLLAQALEQLNPAMLAALNNPLLVDKNRQPTQGILPWTAAAKEDGVKALIDPSWAIDPTCEIQCDPEQENGLTIENFQQAASFTEAMTALMGLMTGHDGLAIQTFKEAMIASSGFFIVNSRGEFFSVAKAQKFIMKGVKGKKRGKVGQFILPHERLDLSEHALRMLKAYTGLELQANQLREWGPDITIPKVDYNMTWRNRCYGIIFAYMLFVDEDQEKFINENCAMDPQWHTMAELEEIEAHGGLTMEAELPIMRKMAACDFKGLRP